MQNYFRPNGLSVDTNQAQKYFDDGDGNGVDESILDHSAIDSGLELSPPMADSRRESFTVGGPGLFSPKTEDWQSVDMQSVPSNNPFLDQHSNNPFMRIDQAQTFGPSAGAWAMDHATPAASLHQFDGISADYDANTSIFQRSLQGPTPFATGNIFGAIGSGNQSIPTSPQKEWIPANQPRKMGVHSPAIRSHNDLRRGDGIRKKNARFDIPAERNLGNIDQLISQCTNEQEVKELKQQKRLLRNRQAALDSRQRKKQHTERLEDEKKQYNVLVSDMESELVSLRARVEQLTFDNNQCMEYIDTLTLEKDELIRTHTIEEGMLRKRVSVLTEHLHHYESNAMPHAVPSAAAFPGPLDEMNGMAIGGAWDEPSTMFNDYTVEPEPIKREMAVVPAKKNEPSFMGDTEKGASQGGLLFMLFLVGAFVMSNRSTPALPRVSEDVRAASATLLNNVLKDAGVNAQPSGIQAMAPQPSGSAWSHPADSHMNDMNVDSVAPSMLTGLGDALTQPTQEQTNEQIFSISAAQYNGVSDQNFLQNAPERSTSQGRKSLADALSAMRATNKQTGAAEVYTRSLLWDQIPGDVVRNFAKMVAECNNAQNQQQCDEAQS